MLGPLLMMGATGGGDLVLPVTDHLWAHWDAADLSTITESSGSVSQWDDKSGNGRHLSQGTGAEQPSTGVDTINGRNVISFDGTEWLERVGNSELNFVHNGSNATIFIVFEAGNSSNPDALYGLAGNSALASGNRGFVIAWDDRSSISRNEGMTVAIYTGSSGVLASASIHDNIATPQATHIFRSHIDANNADTTERSNIVVDGGAEYEDNLGGVRGTPTLLNATYGLQIGATGNNIHPLVGRIAEVIIYSDWLTTGSSSETEQVEAYLASKWGITI